MNLRFKVLGNDSKNEECFAILSMMQMCFKESSHNIYIFRLIADYGKIFVTFDGDAPICVMETLKNWNDPHDAQIISVATHPEFQNQGIGFFYSKKNDKLVDISWN
jgi:ribosomal protein S18 acetylase RimI-like enzyme